MAKKTSNDQPHQSTKEMLDELDALMERMLAVPVNELDESAASPLPPSPPKPAALAATLTVLQTPTETPAPSKHPPTQPPHVAMPPATPVSYQVPADDQQDLATTIPAPAPITNDVVPPSLLPQVDPLLDDVPDPGAMPATRWGFLPLLWMNLLFDGATYVLGPGGTWMRSEGGRLILGLSGVALLLASAGWFLRDWLGWNW